MSHKYNFSCYGDSNITIDFDNSVEALDEKSAYNILFGIVRTSCDNRITSDKDKENKRKDRRMVNLDVIY